MSGIYLHIPFCKQACHYCDFHFSTSLKNKEVLIKAMLEEIRLRKDYLGQTNNHQLQTVYFGGGTPSLLSQKEVMSVFETLNRHFTIAKNAEITLEANPDDLTKEKIKELRESPVNRLSIGIQSFRDQDLKFMNRAHNAKEAVASVKRSQDAGITNISIDLIYGTPGMDNAAWKKNLAEAFALDVPHLSAYCLTVEKGTALHNFVKAGGEMSITGLNMRLKDNPLRFDSINGDFLFNNNDIVINDFTGRVSNTDFRLKGFFRNILAWFLLDKETLTVDATFASKNIDLNELLSDKNSADKDDNAYTLKLSEYLDLNLNCNIDRLTFRRFDAADIRGQLKMRDKRMIADPLSFATMDGQVGVSGMIDGSNEDKLLITCDASLRKININKLFYQFENFGQEYIQDKNLKGVGTAEVQFASVWSPQLDVDLDKIYVRSDLTIEKGELIRFEPMKELSSFIKLSELEEIKFSNLQNQVEIKNQTIYIPKMEVNSSALNVIASGTHTFDNKINYKVKVLLSDLLSKKAKRAKKENDEFGVVEDDGLGKTALYISMTGTVDDPIVKYDGKSAVEKLRADLKTEKQTLKSILKEEFGWFKKDTTGTKDKKPGKTEDNTKFIIKWDEDDAGKKKEDDDDF